MKMSTKFIHVFAVGLFVLTFMTSFGAPSREDKAIRCKPVYDNRDCLIGFDTIRLKNIIGKKFCDVYDTKVVLGNKYDRFDSKEFFDINIPNRDKLVELFPTCTLHDTVIVVSNYYSQLRGSNQIPHKNFSVAKFNNEFLYIQYCYDGQHKKYSIAESGIYKPEAGSPRNSDMIMLNVFFEWDSDVIMCLIKSTPGFSVSYLPSNNLAQRFILQGGVITDYQEINFNENFWWFLSDCYSRDSIPTKYLRDLRYDSPDSLITRYLQGEACEYFYWKHYRP